METLPKNTEIQIDDSVKIGEFKQYKNHPGKYSLNYIELPKKLEETINQLLGGKNA